MLTGYSTNLPTDALLDVGILMVGNAKIGVTKGAPQFDPARVIENIEFDGKHAPIKGLDRLFHGPASISGSLIELGDASSGAQLAKLEPGSSAASAGSPNVTTITPKVGGGLLASGDYLTDVRLIFERAVVGSGTKQYAAIYFPVGLVVQYGPIQGEDRKTGVIPFKIEARKDMGSGTTADAPYKIELREALPT